MKKYILLALTFLLSLSCSRQPQRGAQTRAIYYWNTTFDIDSVKLRFLGEHHITKLYVRYFDVVPTDGGPMPNATIRFSGNQADHGREIIPVVFILPAALDCDRGRLAAMILERVRQMNATHDIAPPAELQIDCDWTASTRSAFYDFMAKLHQLTDADGIALSVTVRLHQLAQNPPPADRGVLMVYNTGDMRQLDKEKPILDPVDVAPYIRNLKNYPLPLASAYPIYRWELLFRNGRFVDILHSDGELPVLQSDSIVARQPSADDILAARQLVEQQRPECADEIILFDLNGYNIDRYDSATFEKFYN